MNFILFRKLASTFYSTTTVCHGFQQHSGHQRSSSTVFNGEWILQSESNKARMVPKINKVGIQTQVGETVHGSVSNWGEKAKRIREKGQNLDEDNDACYFNGSIPVVTKSPSYGTSEKNDYGFKPRGISTATLHKEPVAQSAPVVTVPIKNLEVERDVDVRLKRDSKPKPLKSGKSSSGGNVSNENEVAFGKVEKSTESSKVRENLKKIYDKVHIVDNVSAAKDAVAKLSSQYRNLVHACDTEVCCILISKSQKHLHYLANLVYL